MRARLALLAGALVLALLAAAAEALPARLQERAKVRPSTTRRRTSTSATTTTRTPTPTATPTTTATLTTAPPTPTATAPLPPSPPGALGPSDFLKANGSLLVNRLGQSVLLRGVNIGGWLVTEAWMNGQVDSYLNGRAALEQLEARFGTGPAAQLMKAWQDSWFTAADLDLIKSWGFNCIRVPFSWRNLQDAAGNWILDPSGNIDFSRFDWVVTEAGNRGIYVILDFHYWPRQAEPNNYGLPSRWTTDGGIVRQQMAAIWTEIAKHFRGDPRVAGFDVINEPEGSPWNAPHNAFEDAIKAQDPDRLIIVEWSGYNNTLAEFGNNSMYSDHYSFDDEASFQGYKASIDAGPNRVPLFLGEMKAGNDTAPGARWMADTMNAQNWHWCIWTYKGVSVGGWAAFNYYTQLRYNLSSDPFESIMDKWSRGLVQWQNASAPANSYKTQWWIDGFRQN